jgi:dTMP kinase
VPAVVACAERLGRECVVTREPGGTVIGRAIRTILLAPQHCGLEPMAELLLYMADRAQHVAEVIRPAMKAGKVVVCDRYGDATLAYQGYARGLDLDLIHTLHDIVLGGLTPDLTLLLDLPAHAGLSRAWSQIDSGLRGREETRFEEEHLDFHRKVRAGYLELARQAPARFRVIDASADPSIVGAAIHRAVTEILAPEAKGIRKRTG